MPTLVDKFNNLPQAKYMPKYDVFDNHWHFSVRQVQRSPPVSVLFVVHPVSGLAHAEGGFATEFYDSADMQDKANYVFYLLLRAFIKGLSLWPPQAARPWTWACNSTELASELEKRLADRGVTAPQKVEVATQDENDRVARHFEEWQERESEMMKLQREWASRPPPRT